MYIVQRVINQLKNINTKIRPYIVCLILSSDRKNCASMARSVGISPKRLYAYLKQARANSKEIQKYLFDCANKTRIEGVKRALVIDPTSIIKRYAQAIENLCHDKTGSTKHIERCLVPLYASVVDKNVKIPIALDFWVQEKIVGKKRYKSKRAIARDLIFSLKRLGLKFDFVSLDGAFPFNDMFTFFTKESLNFSMRIARTRCIITADGVKAQLQFHPALKLPRNTREKTVKAKLNNGQECFFAAQKRKNKNDEWEVVYIISNMSLSAKEHVETYNLRWPQEKINRTTKQKFGAEHCQVLEASKQQAHILAGFLAHTILEMSFADKQKKNVDGLVNILRSYYFDDLKALLPRLQRPKVACNIDFIERKFQNLFQNFSENTVGLDVFGP
jgi:SRSO17 transposase